MHILHDITADVDRLAPTVAEIDLARLRHNARVLQARAGGAELMGVVKADAYGHGAVSVVRALQAEGVRRFAVATVPEGIRLREAGVDDAILVFGAPLPETLPAYVACGLEVTVASEAAADAVAAAARTQGPLRAHLKVDTGMGRLGVPPADAARLVRRLKQAPGVTLAGLWTHFATSDDPDPSFAYEQLARFEAALAPLYDAAEYVHVANSAAVLRLPESHRAFGRALVRAGIGLYGLTALPGLAEAEGLRPVMRLVSRVAHVKTVEAGATISYGRRWRAEAPTRIATVAAGYADGYPRLVSGRADVGLGGRRYPVAGTVCMDMFMVDLGDPAGPGAGVEVGHEAVLFGEGGPSTMEVAGWAKTIPYEICCGVGGRVPRVYHGG